MYTIEPPKTTEEMLGFLKQHENSTLFLLGNYKNHGVVLTDSPYSGNFKVIRSNENIVGVLSLTRKGNLLIESTVNEPIFEKVLEACLEEPIPLKGLVGNWSFCGPFFQFIQKHNIIERMLFNSKEILYSLDLFNATVSKQPNVRFLKEEDFATWMPHRRDYHIGEGLPLTLSDKELFEQFAYKVREKIIWGYFLDDALVSMADLNAKALDLGQVGGVYTVPAFRGRGYSKSVMRQILCDAKELHGIRKLIIFTGERNFAAQNVYRSLGVGEVGNFALLFWD